MDPDEERKLALLRVQLYTAMQSLKGDGLAEFWKLIDEIAGMKSLYGGGEESNGET